MSSGNSREQQRNGGRQECVYCGLAGPLTRDHVVPKALFHPPLPANMLTVASCFDCNQRKSDLDTYLRDVLTADISSYDNPTARALLEGQVRRSVRRNRSPLWREARTRTRWVPIHTPAGIYLGTLPAMPVDGDKLNRALTLLTKGLFAACFGQRAPNDCTFDIGRLDPALVAQQRDRLIQAGTHGPITIGPEVFVFLKFKASDNPLIVHWLLEFYTNIFFIITTQSAALVASSPFALQASKALVRRHTKRIPDPKSNR